MLISIYQNKIDTILQCNAPPVWVHEKFLHKILPPAREGTSKRETLSQSITCLRNGRISPKKNKKMQHKVQSKLKNKINVQFEWRSMVLLNNFQAVVHLIPLQSQTCLVSFIGTHILLVVSWEKERAKVMLKKEENVAKKLVKWHLKQSYSREFDTMLQHIRNNKNVNEK